MWNKSWVRFFSMYLSAEKFVCRWIRKLEPDMEQWTDSKLGKEYDKAVYCHPAYLTSMQSAVHSLSVVSDSEIPWTAAHQAPLSMGILQARILEWVAIPSSRGSSRPRDWTQVSCTAGGFFTDWATREDLYAECIMQNAGLEESQAESRLQGEISTPSDMQMILL